MRVLWRRQNASTWCYPCSLTDWTPLPILWPQHQECWGYMCQPPWPALPSAQLLSELPSTQTNELLGGLSTMATLLPRTTWIASVPSANVTVYKWQHTSNYPVFKKSAFVPFLSFLNDWTPESTNIAVCLESEILVRSHLTCKMMRFPDPTNGDYM